FHGERSFRPDGSRAGQAGDPGTATEQASVPPSNLSLQEYHREPLQGPAGPERVKNAPGLPIRPKGEESKDPPTSEETRWERPTTALLTGCAFSRRAPFSWRGYPIRAGSRWPPKTPRSPGRERRLPRR